MYKFKKSTTTILLYFAIVIFVIFVFFVFFAIYNKTYNNNESNHVEGFSLRKTFNSQKRRVKNFNKKHLTKYTSKIKRFFKSVF
jgi:flagellar basal body-associated protein FliL